MRCNDREMWCLILLCNMLSLEHTIDIELISFMCFRINVEEGEWKIKKKDLNPKLLMKRKRTTITIQKVSGEKLKKYCKRKWKNPRVQNYPKNYENFINRWYQERNDENRENTVQKIILDQLLHTHTVQCTRKWDKIFQIDFNFNPRAILIDQSLNPFPSNRREEEQQN